MSKFRPGQSGNPKGRPKGTGQAARLREAIADQLDMVISAMIDQAKSGDVNAARLLLDKCLPNLKTIDAPTPIRGISDSNGTFSERADMILAMIEQGEVTTEQALKLLAAMGEVEGVKSRENLPTFEEFLGRTVPR